MIAVIQRVSRASVVVAGQTVGQIQRGLLALVAVHKDDTDSDVDWMARKIVGLRVFPNGEKNFDLDVAGINGSILLVSNFTVAGATAQGRRPSLDAAADPAKGRALFDALVVGVKSTGMKVATGQFGAHMDVELINDGPVTVLLDGRDGRQGRENA